MSLYSNGSPAPTSTATPETNGIRKVQHYDNILEALQRAFLGSTHIAGGAVRDTLLERQIRDIDIFVRNDASDKAADVLRARFGYVKVGQWERYEHFSDPMVARVAKFEKADETIPICLIGLVEDLNARDNIARFDFGVCMAAWSGGDFMHTDDRFKRDVESKTFTLCRADNLAQFSYSMVRFKKLTADRYRIGGCQSRAGSRHWLRNTPSAGTGTRRVPTSALRASRKFFDQRTADNRSGGAREGAAFFSQEEHHD